MNKIARCDWLPERARWSHLARSGLPAVSRKHNFPKSHIINPLLTKFIRSRWLDIGLVLFFANGEAELTLGRVVRKPVNVNPGLNVNCSTIFSCLKMFFISNVW